MACGILVPQPRIKPRPPAVEVQSPNHWTTREFSCLSLVGFECLRWGKWMAFEAKLGPVMPHTLWQDSTQVPGIIFVMCCIETKI